MNWAYDGQKVMFAYRRGTAVLCTVVCAMGNTVRVVNPLFKIDTWADVDEVQPAPEGVYDRKESVAGEKGILHPVEP